MHAYYCLDTKLFRKIKGNGDEQQLQDDFDIDKLIKWSEKWQLFNFLNYNYIHGHGNTGVNYEIGGTILYVKL